MSRLGGFRNLVVLVSTTSSWTDSSEGQQLPDDRLEASLPRGARNPPSSSNVPLPHCILPSCRWSEHDWHARLHHPEQHRVLFVPRNHIPRSLTGSLFDYFDIWILVHSEILWYQDEIHVHGHQCVLRIYSFLWDDWTLDKQGWVSPCSGLLDLQYFIRTVSGSILRLRSDHDV